MSGELVHEMWEEQDGCTMVCLAGPQGDRARASLAAGARLALVFHASSHFDAMTKYHAHVQRPAYTTNQPWDLEPYPCEWVAEQHAALAAMAGNRE